jgi:hypothetical protein
MSSKRFSAPWYLSAVLIAAACFFGGCQIVWEDKEKPDIDGPGANPQDSVPIPPDSGIKPPIDTSGTNPPELPDTTLDSRLVGDWLTIYEDGDGMEMDITKLTASGKMIIGGFLKVGDFWIESWEHIGTWRTSNDTLYGEVVDTVVYGTPPIWQYTIHGNRINLRSCGGVSPCEEVVSEKINVDTVRSRLGTVQRQDPALYTSTVYTDLLWNLEEDEFEYLDFDMMYFLDGERYFGYKVYYDQVWYTTGSRLFLIGMDSFGRVQKNVELEYGAAGAGVNARLSIRPYLEDGSLGPEDIWLPAQYDDSDWYWQPRMSKQSKKAVKSRKRAFVSSLRTYKK